MEVIITKSKELEEFNIINDEYLHNIIQLFKKENWSTLYRMFCFNGINVPISPITLQIELKIDTNQKLGDDEFIIYAVLAIDGKKSFIISSFDVYIFDILEKEMREIYQDVNLSNIEKQAMKVDARTKAFVMVGSRLLRRCCKRVIQDKGTESQMEWYNFELNEHIEREMINQNKHDIKVPLADPVLR
ncbi:MAG: hypothetical protein IKC49_02940 [Clostridia bacterium]|nr:hypothetical protein [Clostridia bacterium]